MASPRRRHPVSVKATYSIPKNDTVSHSTNVFDSSNCQPALIGLAPGVTAQKPEAGDFAYSGVHDHGVLHPPREGGDMALLIGCVNEAKQFSDRYLTQVIHDEKLIGTSSEEGHTKKKAKTEKDGT